MFKSLLIKLLPPPVQRVIDELKAARADGKITSGEALRLFRIVMDEFGFDDLVLWDEEKGKPVEK